MDTVSKLYQFILPAGLKSLHCSIPSSTSAIIRLAGRYIVVFIVVLFCISWLLMSWEYFHVFFSHLDFPLCWGPFQIFHTFPSGFSIFFLMICGSFDTLYQALCWLRVVNMFSHPLSCFSLYECLLASFTFIIWKFVLLKYQIYQSFPSCLELLWPKKTFCTPRAWQCSPLLQFKISFLVLTFTFRSVIYLKLLFF